MPGAHHLPEFFTFASLDICRGKIRWSSSRGRTLLIGNRWIWRRSIACCGDDRAHAQLLSTLDAGNLQHDGAREWRPRPKTCIVIRRRQAL